MKILFDARWINNDSPDGITRYSRELIKALHASTKLDLLISSMDQLNGLPKLGHILTNKPTSPKELRQARALNGFNYDVVFTPHYIFGGNGRKFRLVRTVHDLIPFNQRSDNSKLAWRVFYSNLSFLKKLLNDSDGIVTVSETVKKQLAKITSKRIAVVCNAATGFSHKPAKTKKQILYIGRYEEYKNIKVLVSAINDLSDYKLDLAGDCSEKIKASLLSFSTNKSQIKFLGRIKDSDYLKLLSESAVLALPSREEGFGLPVIEAMSAGCPVVCSDIDIFREVGGEAGLYFDPNSSDEVVDIIRQLENAKYRKEIVAKALLNAKRFSWTKSAIELKLFLDEI